MEPPSIWRRRTRGGSHPGGEAAPWRKGLFPFAAALALVVAAPAWAVDYTLVKWKKTGQCEVVTTLPLWGDHWVMLGAYTSKAQAETALSKMRRTRACPPSKAVKPAETKVEPPPKKTVTQHSNPYRFSTGRGW